jgi:hypothetical protein
VQDVDTAVVVDGVDRAAVLGPVGAEVLPPSGSKKPTSVILPDELIRLMRVPFS